MMRLEHDGKKSPEQIGLAGLKLEILAKSPLWRLFYDQHKIFSIYEKFTTVFGTEAAKNFRGLCLYVSLFRKLVKKDKKEKSQEVALLIND